MTIVYLSGNSLTGSSGDTKPNNVAVNSTFLETDTNKTFKYTGSSWVGIDVGVGDSVSNAELDGSINYNKLSLTGAILNADLAGSISNDKLAGSISLSKIANGTPGKIIGFNATTGVIEEQDTAAGITSFTNSAVVSQSTTIGNYTTPTAAVATSPSPVVEYLVIGGGGGGGESGGGGAGGGGAGGYRTASGFSVATQTYAITVGVGGVHSVVNGQGGAGGNSIFDTITSIGGGGGGGYSNLSSVTGGNGGSGGGGGYNATTGGTGTSGQGFGGGGGQENASHTAFTGGGGGGASSAGTNGAGTTRGTGGSGTASSITGVSVTYAGGGGGGGYGSGGVQLQGGGGSGGSGGGGTGANYTTNATNGGANTGSGGGGAAGSAGSAGIGGDGGAGVVIIKYLTSNISATGGTITTSGSYTIHSFTSSGSFVVTVTNGSASAIDNNTATRWTTDSVTNPNIYVDMGSALNLCAAAFYFDSTNTTNTEILIQSSADASTWTTKRTITKSDLTNGAYNFYRFNIAGGARYIRFYGNSAGSTVLSIWEIKILKKTDAEIFNDLGMLTITSNNTALAANGT